MEAMMEMASHMDKIRLSTLKYDALEEINRLSFCSGRRAADNLY